MSGFPASPYYIEIDDKNSKKHLWPVTCFNHGTHLGDYLDVERNMWVCSQCFKPGIDNQAYVTECIFCSKEGVPWISDGKGNNSFICKECGGDNEAEPYKTTKEMTNS